MADHAPTHEPTPGDDDARDTVHAELAGRVEALWERAGELSPADADALEVVTAAIDLLDSGEARIAEIDPLTDQVVVHQWLKHAILLLFRLRSMETIEAGPFEFADKLPLKHDYEAAGVRVVPGASARWGSYLAPGVICMPSYVNIGARVGAGLQDAIDAGLGDVSALVDIFEGNGPVALFKQLDDVERLGKDGNEIEPLDL